MALGRDGRPREKVGLPFIRKAPVASSFCGGCPPRRVTQLLTSRAWDWDLFGNRVFADGIKLRSYWIMGALNPTWTQALRGEGPAKVEAEVKGTCPRARNAKGCQPAPEAGRGREGPPLEPEGLRGTLTLDIHPPEPLKNPFLCLKPSSWRYFAMAAPGNSCTLSG